jgi:hypothetical protein
MCLLLAMPSTLHPHFGIAECHIQLIYSSQHVSFASWRIYYKLFNEQAQRGSNLVEAIFKLVDEAVPHYALGFQRQHSDKLGLVDAKLSGMLVCNLSRDLFNSSCLTRMPQGS